MTVESFAERCELIRKEAGLSRAKFAEIIEVPASTLDGVESKGRIPGGDLLQKILNKFPQYSQFLMTGDISPSVAQTYPITGTKITKNCIRIIDSIDSRYAEKCIVKPNEFEKLILIQSCDNENDLAGIITLKNNDLYAISNYPHQQAGIWINAGNINFASRGGGRQALFVFRKWLEENNKQCLEKSEYMKSENVIIDEVYKKLELQLNDISKYEQNDFLSEAYKRWKNGDENWN